MKAQHFRKRFHGADRSPVLARNGRSGWKHINEKQEAIKHEIEHKTLSGTDE